MAEIQCKILVVEHEPTLVETLDYSLRRQDYRVVTATDGRMAVETARKEQPIWLYWTSCCPVWTASRSAGSCARR